MKIGNLINRTAQSKKKIEERILGNFLSHPSLRLRVSGITPMDPPDFVIKRYVQKKFKRISVELTSVMNPNLKQMESAQKKIVDIAWGNFRKKYNTELVVLVYFSRVPFSMTNNSIKQLGSDLADIVSDIFERNKDCEFRIHTKRPLSRLEFESINVSNDDSYGIEYWQPHGTFRVPLVDENWFAEIIRKKELKISGYPEEFEEKWLVLLANFGHQSSHFQFTNIKKEFKNSPFDRIFIYKQRENEIIKVKY